MKKIVPPRFIPLLIVVPLVAALLYWKFGDHGAVVFPPPSTTPAIASATSLAGAATNATHLPDVVARVNGVEIKKGDLENAVASVRDNAATSGTSIPPGREEEMYRGLLDDLIATELLNQESKAREVAVTDNEIDSFIRGFKERFPSEAAFQAALAKQQVTMDQLRVDVKKQLRIKKLLDEMVLSKIAIGPDAAKNTTTTILRSSLSRNKSTPRTS
jgi:hypothetical protein